MKGIIFTLLENRIREDHGEDVWDEVLAEAGVDGVYTTLGNYPHEDLLDLLEAAEPYTGYSGREAQRWFGHQALHQLADKYPHLFEPHDTTRSFALNLNEVIHPEVRKLYPGAHVPTFRVEEDPEEGDLELGYRSERGLCSFAEGLLLGTADRYDERIDVHQPTCVHLGDPHCELVLDVQAGSPREGTEGG